jgi:hypothetical protein
VTCASFRRRRSQLPRPLERLGIDENAKITAAQASTGSHAAHPDRGVVRADVDIVEW